MVLPVLKEPTHRHDGLAFVRWQEAEQVCTWGLRAPIVSGE